MKASRGGCWVQGEGFEDVGSVSIIRMLLLSLIHIYANMSAEQSNECKLSYLNGTLLSVHFWDCV